MIYRKLTTDNYIDYKELRLEMLKNNPSSFGSSYEDESIFSDEVWKIRVSKETVYPLGAFDGQKLVGFCAILKSPREKMKHVASLHSMYVRPSYRKQSIARNLIKHAIDHCLKNNVEILNLSVVTTNENAINLYKSFGFIEYGIEPKTIKIQNEYHSLLLLSKEL